MYATEHYWKDKASYLRRYTIRLDGFVSVNASFEGGELLTKPFIFKGDGLHVNFSSSAAGSILVELISETAGKPIEGFTLNDCYPIFGDSVDRKVEWKTASDLHAIQGKMVRLRFVLKDADIFAFQFK